VTDARARRHRARVGAKNGAHAQAMRNKNVASASAGTMRALGNQAVRKTRATTREGG
jgi:hypothetical protein